jgi:large subunit ribosomal protein L24
MKWSVAWKKSTTQGKQRKYARNAPAHIRTKLIKGHLSKELKTKHKKRSLRIKQGDTVKIMRGSFKGKTGKVDRVDTKKSKVFVNGIERVKKDGSKTLYPITPSNILITVINLNDKKRIKKNDKSTS